MSKSIFNTVKGYLKFNLEHDIELDGLQRSINKSKKYTLKQQQKQCDKAFKELQKQESKGLITNLNYTQDTKGVVIMTWERVS